MLYGVSACGLLLVAALIAYTTEAGTMPTPKSPPIVAFVRGIILAVLGAGASTAVIYASNNGDTIKQYWWAPFVLVGLRSLEGAVDKKRGQAPQAGVLGSKPADPNAYKP